MKALFRLHSALRDHKISLEDFWRELEPLVDAARAIREQAE